MKSYHEGADGDGLEGLGVHLVNDEDGCALRRSCFAGCRVSGWTRSGRTASDGGWHYVKGQSSVSSRNISPQTLDELLFRLVGL